MAVIETYVFVHLAEGPVPAGILTMTDEQRTQFSTFAYGRRYLERPDRIPVDPVALPLTGGSADQTFRTEEGFAVFGGISTQPNSLKRPNAPKRLTCLMKTYANC